MKRYRFSILWGYLAELVAAGLLYALLVILFGRATIVRVTLAAAWPLAAFVGGVFAVSFALVGVYFGVCFSEEFDDWLAWRGADRVYATAFVVSVLVSSVASVVLIIAKVEPAGPLPDFAAGLSILTVLVLASLVKNALGLVRLNREFRKAMRSEKNKESEE